MAKTITVTVTRPFFLAGERQELGTELDVELLLARELRANGKVSFGEAPPTGPMTTETAGAVVPGKRQRKTD